MNVSRRALSLRPSATLAVAARAKALRDSGVDVLSFAAGEPDFDTPQRIKAAAIAALEAGQTKYGPVPGDLATRQVIATKLATENGIAGVTADHVVLSAGGKQCLFNVFQALLDAPDREEAPWEVLLPAPAWVSYAPQAELAGGRIVELPTTATGGFKITPEQLKRAMTPRSRLLVLNSPSNPCGTMYSPSELRAIAKVVEEAAKTVAPDLVVVSDEIYEKIVYGGIEQFSIGAAREIAERVITVNGLSKAYSMTGWRIGYMAGSGEFGLKVAKAAGNLQSQSTTSIPTFFMPAIRVALTECADEVEQMRLAFARRGELIFGLVSEIPGLVCPKPTGAFYIFPDVSAHFGKQSAQGRAITSAMTFADALLNEAHVACVPGEDFGTGGERCCRLSFACGEAQIREGMKRLGEFVSGLRG